MQSSFTYPVVSYETIIRLFHAILFWRHEEKAAKGIHPKFRFLTFNTVWAMLQMANILPEQRVEHLRGNRELCKLFLKQTVVLEERERDVDYLSKKAVFKHFLIRKGNRELTSGNTVNRLELCSRTKVFITPFGIREAPTLVEYVSHLLTKDTYASIWERYTAPYRNRPAVIGHLTKARNEALDKEIWGVPLG